MMQKAPIVLMLLALLFCCAAYAADEDVSAKLEGMGGNGVRREWGQVST